MQIHNFYSDLLLSIRTLFDNKIFNPTFINSYSFNIANRSFELSKKDYKPNYALPAAIVTLEEEEYTFGERPNIIQRFKTENINTIPVLVDNYSSNVIYIQEEHSDIKINVRINCESQFQAKEIEFRTKRILPLNKYIQLLEFTSFLEIPAAYLKTLGMDFNNREIANLFMRLNSNTGFPEYCYSLHFNPLIKLNSITSNISDKTQRSFSVDISLSYQIQVPVWIVNDKLPDTIENINIDFTSFGHEPISYNSMRPIINDVDQRSKYGDVANRILCNLLIHDIQESQFEYTKLTNPKDENKYIHFVRINLSRFVEYGIETIIETNKINIFDKYGNFHKNISNFNIDDSDENNIILTLELSDEQLELLNGDLTNPSIIQFVSYDLSRKEC